jgi:hypothetical protein
MSHCQKKDDTVSKAREEKDMLIHSGNPYTEVTPGILF